MNSLNYNNKDLLSKLKLKNEKLLRDPFNFDRTDTVSIASVQSSIFDFDSSLTSQKMENIKKDHNKIYNKISNQSYKVRPFKFKDKMPENWLYCNPKEKEYENNISNNPIEWMRTIFDDNDIIPQSCKSNLTHALSRSQANLMSINSDFSDDVSPQLYSYKSVSDLKSAEKLEEMEKNDQFDSLQYHLTESKTAPGSVENIAESRSSFQECMALVRQQEEKLKAEVLKRKCDMNIKNSFHKVSVPSVRYIKNSRKSVPINKFGFPDLNANPSKIVSTRYSTQNSFPINKLDISSFKLKPTLQPSEAIRKPSDKLHIRNAESIRRSLDYKRDLKLYHV